MLLKSVIIWIVRVFGLLLILSHEGWFFTSAEGADENGVCGDIDIRNDVKQLSKLENCSAIEGSLHILLIMEAKQEDYDQFHFPKLVEITGHLLLYRVYGLRSLKGLFPNLRVIRGQDLFYNYALVAFEMPDLEDLGLISLTTIMRGAVRLEKNNKLCYIETIDWSKIATGSNDHFFRYNKDEQECVNQCPEHCPETLKGKDPVKRCWTAEYCQKNLDCKCSGYCQENSDACCHPYCVGGCTGPTSSDCIACRNVTYNGKCEPRCVAFTYMFMSRRCLLDKECLSMKQGKQGTRRWKLIRSEQGQNKSGLCVDKCPPGYTVDESNKSHCKKCKDRCPRECIGKVVDSIDSAQSFKGCTKIRGPLEIQITGGSNIGIELEASLGQIEEVTHYIKIVRSYALVSLDFFKSLRVIHGEKLEHKHYSLVIMDNLNLQELFRDSVTKNLTIKAGKVSFHFNRKLCFDKIKKFLDATGFNDTDIDKTTNGDETACSVRELNLTITRVMHDVAILSWDKFDMADPRKLLGYVINYREVTAKNISIYQGRDACSETVWKTKDVEPATELELLYNLKPWTMYAAYIQTYTLYTARQAAISNIKYFKTLPYHPSTPTELTVTAKVEGELLVTWKPPKEPNGNVTHYIVYWQLQKLDKALFDVRDYCTNPIDSAAINREKEERMQKKNNSSGIQEGQCCRCEITAEEKEEQRIDRLIQIAFENHLQDSVYHKRPNRVTEDKLKQFGPRAKRAIPDSESQAKGRYTTYPTYDVRGMPQDINVTVGTNATVENNTQEEAYSEVRVYGTEVVLPNLGHFQEYNIEVLACQDTNPDSKKYYCGSQAIATARTLPSKTADNINTSTVSVEVLKNQSGEAYIRWSSPPDPNGLIISFEIEYRNARLKDVNPMVVCLTHVKYRIFNGYKLQLSPGNYSFRIRATSLAGNGSWTPADYFVIPEANSKPGLDNAIIVAICISALLIFTVTVIIVWFIAKSRFSKDPDMTTISMNPSYVPSTDVYIPDDWEVDRDKIKLLRELGQGSFGMVYEGLAKDLAPNKGEIKVAIKTVNANAGWHERMSFLKEASIMKGFNCHHVVKLLGVVSKGQPALVIMELMSWGDLKNFLRMHRPDAEENVGLEPITLKRLLRMAAEVSDGMAYLADKKFVHRDLAARNCMVGDETTVKIGDFGMTRDIYETDYYRKGGKGLLPVRWMAPESLKDGIFTTMSDVWSFGVVLWEMATLAAQPYQGLANEEVLKYVVEGRNMEKPDGCPEKLYDLMTMCWHYRAKDRPTFKQIIEILVPDLDISFKDVSYFFSEENRGEEAIGSEFDDDGAEMDPCEEDLHSEMIVEEEEEEDLAMLQDEARVHLMSAVEGDLNNMNHLQSSPSRHHMPDSIVSPCECTLLEEMPSDQRHSTCSSPNSAIGMSDGSKGSSKSSGSSYSHMNGLTNGHIHYRLPRTTHC